MNDTILKIVGLSQTYRPEPARSGQSTRSASTCGPGSSFPVELPRPRDQIATKEEPDFAHLRSEVVRLVMESTRRTSIVEKGSYEG